MKDEDVGLHIHVPKSLHKKLRLYAIKKNTSVKDLITGLIKGELDGKK